MIEAKAGYANDVAAAHNQKIQDATMRFLKRSAPAATEDKIKLWAELLMLAPVGLRYDKPTIETYRQRLTEFATMVAEQVQGSRD